MSRARPESRAAVSLRKQRQRAIWREAGRTKVEAWISRGKKDLLQAFANRIAVSPTAVAEMVLEHATPLYLRELQRRVDRALPLYREVLRYEHYGVVPSPTGKPVRIGIEPLAVVLDPAEHHRLREALTPILGELARYGLSPKILRRLARSEAPEPPGRRKATRSPPRAI